ncbi:MAG: nuclear transport factor 2 family protein [Allosphingosinicella sp.]
MRIQESRKPALLLPVLLLCGCDQAGPRDSRPAAGPDVPAKAAQAPLTPARTPAEAARDEAGLIRLERDYAHALMTRDRAFLMRFYASDWRGGNWMGFWSKSTLLKSVLGARYVVKRMEVRDLKVRLMGDVAIVQGVDEEVTSVDGKDTSGKWAFTDVFARRDGQWVAVASHTSEVRPTGE